jgi:hypothetical protein
MLLLPYHRAVIDSPLSSSDLEAAIEEHVDRRPLAEALLQGYDERTPFKGGASGDGFTLWCMQYGVRSPGRLTVQSSFMPVIRGRYESSGQGTRVTIWWRLKAVTMVVMAIWFAFFLVAGVEIGSDLLAGATEPRPILLVIPAMFVAGWALMSWAFWSHVHRTEEILRRILENEVLM